jgi:ornithine carbamoyltransferase
MNLHSDKRKLLVNLPWANSLGAMVHTPDEKQGAEIINKYSSWITDERRMKLAKPAAIYIHPLPADRNIEVTDGVMDGRNPSCTMKPRTACTRKRR